MKKEIVKWIEYRVRYSSGFTSWELTEVDNRFDSKDMDDLDWLIKKENIVRDDDHYRGIDVREVEPSFAYLSKRINEIKVQMLSLDMLKRFYVEKLKKAIEQVKVDIKKE